MTRKERLLATLAGRTVDRPAVNFYEIGGFVVNPSDPDPYNIYHSPDWQPLLKLAEEHTDLIRMMKVKSLPKNQPIVQTWEEGRSRFTKMTLCMAGKEYTSLTRRDADIDTVWHLEHLLKNEDDVEAWLTLPEDFFDCTYDITPHLQQEALLGDKGIVMMDFPDHLNRAARLMDMQDFLMMAFANPGLMHRLLERTARLAQREADFTAAAFPGHLWRLTGAEYATEPYMSPDLFRDYWLRYATAFVKTIHATGGIARVHLHGRIKRVLDALAESGADAIDPIEPPHQGDVELSYVREKYGKQFVLFGNLEITDIENLPPEQFRDKIKRALDAGTQGEGRGFVLMPSAAPYGRTISSTTLQNYEQMIELTHVHNQKKA
jgi:hypothetical protein